MLWAPRNFASYETAVCLYAVGGSCEALQRGYLKWLSEHLKNIPDVIVADQEVLWSAIEEDADPGERAASLGCYASCHLQEYALFAQYFDSGTGFVEARERHLDLWTNHYQSHRLAYMDPFDINWFNREIWNAYFYEYTCVRILGRPSWLPDLGYRLLLGAILAGVEDEDKRLQVLGTYFQNVA